MQQDMSSHWHLKTVNQKSDRRRLPSIEYRRMHLSGCEEDTYCKEECWSDRDHRDGGMLILRSSIKDIKGRHGWAPLSRNLDP